MLPVLLSPSKFMTSEFLMKQLKQPQMLNVAIAQAIILGAGPSQSTVLLIKSIEREESSVLAVSKALFKLDTRPWYQRESQRGGKKFAKQATKLRG
jgi:hypothetical protein